jgi:hypothetical protein
MIKWFVNRTIKKTKQKLKIDFEWLKTIENVPKKGEPEKP